MVTVVAAALLAAPAMAAPRAQLGLTTDRIEVGQAIVAQVVVVGTPARRPPTIPVNDGVTIAFSAKSERIDLRPGRATSIYSYQYAVRANAEGTYTLGPVQIETTDGKRLETEAVTLRVTPSTDPSSDAARFVVSGGFEESEAWEGQVVHYVYDARVRGRVVDVRWRFPVFEGLREPQQGGRGDEQYQIMDPDGEITVSHGVLPLVATATGRKEHPASLAVAELRTGRPGLFGMVRTTSERMATDPSSLVVRPLPVAPDNFTGLVGDFVFESTLETARAAVGQSVTWTLRVAGDGTLEGFSWSAPEVDGATVYGGETQHIGRVEDGEYLGMAIAENVLVPTQSGQLQVPPLELVTFSPSRGAYQTHEISVPPLMVTGSADGQSVAVESFATEVEEIVEGDGIDFRDIYRWGLATTPHLGPVLPLMAGAAALPGAAVFGVLGAQWVAARRRQRATVEVAPTASAILASLPAERGEARWAALDAALRIALADRVDQRVETMDREAALALVPDALAADLRELFGVLDRARFAANEPEGDVAPRVRDAVAALEAS